MSWVYNGKEYTEPEEKYVGFVYLITEKETGKKYIGKKLFFKTIRKKVNKKLKRVLVQTDWQSYYGSSKTLQEKLKQVGNENYHREILRLCKSKTEMTYYEMKEQIDREVLFDDNYYNDYVGGRVRGKWLNK